MAESKADIQGVELLVIAERKPNERGNSWKLRVVHWVVDGKSKSVKLEKRNFFVDDYGKTKNGKADGLKLEDLEACKPHWKNIMALLKSPPPVKLSDDAQKQAGDENIEDVPF